MVQFSGLNRKYVVGGPWAKFDFSWYLCDTQVRRSLNSQNTSTLNGLFFWWPTPRHWLYNRLFARKSKAPWKECNVMDERINSWPGYLTVRTWRRCAGCSTFRTRPAQDRQAYNDNGPEALTDRSHRAYPTTAQKGFELCKHLFHLHF